MAKVGEGDPRWIVQNRVDGKNVNHWHWTEQDWSSWIKDRMVNTLNDMIIETDQLEGKTSSVQVTGDVTVNTRKQKTIIFYELEVNMKWEATLLSTQRKGKGTLQIPYISEENDLDDFEIRITVENEDRELESLKNLFRAEITPILKKKVPILLVELRKETEEATKLKLKVEPTAKILDKIDEPIVSPKQTPEKPKEEKKPTKSTTSTGFDLQEKFLGCSTMDLFFCFVDVNRVRAYAGSDAKISSEKGGTFSLFGGSVTGENLEVEPGKKLIQKWRFNSWPKDVYSTVSMEFIQKDSKVVLKLKQTGIPSDELEHTKEGWSVNYFHRIKGVFGYGGLSI